MIARFDRQLRHVYVNPAAARAGALSPGEYAGKTIAETGVPEQYCSLWNARIRKVFKTAERVDCDDCFPTPDGMRWFQTRLVPELAADGSVHTVLSVANDITERKRMEEALRVSEERLQQAVRASGLGIFGHDHRTDVIHWSPEMRQIYGFGPEEPVNMPIVLERVHPEDRRRVAAAIRRAHDPAGDGLYAIEHRMVRRDGSVRWLIRRSQTFFEGEAGSRRPLRTVGAVIDITERKRAEEAERRAHDELEAKVKERTTQLRTLTAKLIGAEEAERERIADILHEDLQQMLVALLYEIETLRVVATRADKKTAFAEVNGILHKAIEVTRSLSADLQPPRLYDMGLSESLAWVADEMKSRFGLSVRLTVTPGAEPAQADLRAFIVASVRELLFNVVKHAGAKAAHLRMEREDDRIKIEVKDGGKGCDMTRNPPAGLGLFKIRERADYLGGEFRIVSSPRKGTCATLVLPRG